MRKIRFWAIAAAMLLCLSACARKPVETEPPVTTAAETTEATIPVTVPADGDPNNVTCKGTYTGDVDGDVPVARAGEAVLTNGQLQVIYWAEAAAYLQSGEMPAPDFSQPLDTQICQADLSVASWQQFFLRRALNTWHSAQALNQKGEADGLPVEEAYQPDPAKYERYMKDMPANKFLYRYEKSFRPNTMHQAWLDALPQMLAQLAGEKGFSDAGELAQSVFGTTGEVLEAFVRDYNLGYMYYTNLSYYIEPSEEELADALRDLLAAGEGQEGSSVDFRHILLIPGASENEAGELVLDPGVTMGDDGRITCSQELWLACEEEAGALMENWSKPKNNPSEGTFAEMAFRNSRDAGTALDGGLYRAVRQGQLAEPLEQWCFDGERLPGDTTVFRSDFGVHILYFSASRSVNEVLAEEACIAGQQADILTLARREYPMEVDYSAITLGEGAASVSLSELLYPDIAHERFPELPLYLQQDYPQTLYGLFEIRTNGCGITTMAMVASYMTDDELTPPELCARFGKYSYVNGTDGIIFLREPPAMGFYAREKTYEPTRAKAALAEGQIVISLQQKGYWTNGGHYIALEKLLEDDMVQVRDSNIFNYRNIRWHKLDHHEWRNIIGHASGFWIFEDKVTVIPACERCGGGEHTTDFLRCGYICRKCTPAILRRQTYLAACGS